eukprot:Colp12_sorted_trinity150504_noHs@31395
MAFGTTAEGGASQEAHSNPLYQNARVSHHNPMYQPGHKSWLPQPASHASHNGAPRRVWLEITLVVMAVLLAGATIAGFVLYAQARANNNAPKPIPTTSAAPITVTTTSTPFPTTSSVPYFSSSSADPSITSGSIMPSSSVDPSQSGSLSSSIMPTSTSVPTTSAPAALCTVDGQFLSPQCNNNGACVYGTDGSPFCKCVSPWFGVTCASMNL